MNVAPSSASDVESKEIDLTEVLRILWKSRWGILLSIAFATGVMAAVTLFIANEYRATGLLAPNKSDEGFSGGLAAQLGGLASIAGIDISGSATDPAVLALETLQSHVFLSGFINERKLKAPLFAATEWDATTKEWRFAPSLYDMKSSRWIGTVEPSDTAAVEKFKKIFSVSQDKRTGLVTVSITSRSPEMAKTWLDWIILDVNRYLRERDAAEARESIEFLERQLEQTSVSEMQKVFYQIIEQQTKIAMLAEVRKQYAFRVIDGPVIQEQPVWPKRSLFVAIAGMLAGIFSCMVLLIRERFVVKEE